MKMMDLNGQWTLAFFEEGKQNPQTPEELDAFDCSRCMAQVPGNVELDLSREGILPEDLFFGTNIHKLRQYESYQWWYTRDFATPEWKDCRDIELVFEGLDCFATVWINGTAVGSSSNAMIRQRFSVGHYLQPAGRTNRVAVRLASPINAVKNVPSEVNTKANRVGHYESLWARKPAHAYGWDIMPRAVSAGIWRPVYLQERRNCEITDVFIDTLDASSTGARLEMYLDFETDQTLAGYSVRLQGQCGESRFSQQWPVFFTRGAYAFNVPNPRLWWPRGYGDANLYDVTVELLHHEKVVSSCTRKVGIRTIHLKSTDIHTRENPGEFQFIVNGVPVFCRGSNWVPADAFHSRDAERIPQMLALFSDMECNMVRCWGGNVYESHLFYDICDREGIMVWQDFGMGCLLYPQHPDFLEIMRQEAEWVVRELRQHASLALWSGDNECDAVEVAITFFGDRKRNPDDNLLTRKVLPETIRLLDPGRDFLPSSPYMTNRAAELMLDLPPEIMKQNGNVKRQYSKEVPNIPEKHYYPHGQYFKVARPVLDSALFFSEIGCLGTPNLESIRKFVPVDALYPDPDHPAWQAHSTSSIEESAEGNRIKALHTQISAFFGTVPEDVERFVLASQIIQAEAKKFYIERLRQRKGEATGILWWNMIDGWPQSSDAIVDYYFSKKLAYHCLKRIHGPLAVIVCEPSDGQMEVVAVNDSLEPRAGTFRIWDADTDETVIGGRFAVGENRRSLCGAIPCPRETQRMYLIQWEGEGGNGCSHYLYGEPPFNLGHYMDHWLPAIAALDGSFGLFDNTD